METATFIIAIASFIVCICSFLILLVIYDINKDNRDLKPFAKWNSSTPKLDYTRPIKLHEDSEPETTNDG